MTLEALRGIDDAEIELSIQTDLGFWGVVLK
jgi:hypothetical protein